MSRRGNAIRCMFRTFGKRQIYRGAEDVTLDCWVDFVWIFLGGAVEVFRGDVGGSVSIVN